MDNKRTIQQNKALHKYYEMLATSLNDSGFDMKKTLKPQADIPWTPVTVKEYLWRPIQDAMLHKESTTELDRKEINDVYEVLTRHLGEKLGIEATPFPAIEEDNHGTKR